MPIHFTFAEGIELLKYGKFTLLSFDGTIPAGVTDPVIARASVDAGWKILTERFNWGGTDIPDKVYYELWYEKGFYCGSNIRQSNLENRCTHLFAASFIDVKLWNVSSPSVPVYFDFSVWYYTYMTKYEENVMDILFKTPKLLENILEELKAGRQRR